MKELSQKQQYQLIAYQNDAYARVWPSPLPLVRSVAIHVRGERAGTTISNTSSEDSNTSFYEPIKSIRRWIVGVNNAAE